MIKTRKTLLLKFRFSFRKTVTEWEKTATFEVIIKEKSSDPNLMAIFNKAFYMDSELIHQ